ncbi:MAG: peptidoglycan glycosyltransferase [Lachnospiraceae bacterium]|nr:peptidoglycan glycosyltransferase [Lachnospiraceae bacterium]
MASKQKRKSPIARFFSAPKLRTRFLKRMQKKVIVSFSLVALLLIGLSGRLMYISYTSGEKYEKIVLSQQQYDSKSIPYQRGDIVDAKGTVLATSIAVYNVILDCSVLNSDEKYLVPTVEALVECFPEHVTAEQIYTYARDRKDSMYIVLAKRLSYDTVQQFIEIQEATDEKGNKINPYVKGVWFEKEYQRQYPYGALASSVIGFTASGNVGVNGLESYYNSTLNGIDGREYGYLNADSDFEKTIKDAIDGNTLVATLDATIQTVVEKKIAEFNEVYKNNYRRGEGAEHIAVIVMNPNNGDVLAMANYPNYDLNNPRDLSAYYSESEIAAMDDDTKLKKLNELWQNFCVYYTYEPGSTAKAFTIATGLETGTVFTGDVYECDGHEMIPGYSSPIHCVSKYGHGAQTIKDALMNSCNDALMQMSYRIGVQNFTEYQHTFGFGQKTNIDLPGEARTDSLLYTVDNMKKIDLATNSFGQNYNCTMIQMASAFSSLVNGGHLYQPRMVKAIADENGNIIKEVTPTLLRETVSKETSDTLKRYLYATVSDGTGQTAKVDGYSLGGKTGTAEKIPRDDVSYLVSFIGFAPVENPELVIYCIIDEPNVDDQPHSTFAQNIVREILEEIMPYMNIYPDEETTGLHLGWDITGAATGQQATTDIVIENLFNEATQGVPNTMDELTASE